MRPCVTAWITMSVFPSGWPDLCCLDTCLTYCCWTWWEEVVTQVIILSTKITGKVWFHLETYQSSLGREARYHKIQGPTQRRTKDECQSWTRNKSRFGKLAVFIMLYFLSRDVGCYGEWTGTEVWNTTQKVFFLPSFFLSFCLFLL